MRKWILILGILILLISSCTPQRTIPDQTVPIDKLRQFIEQFFQGVFSAPIERLESLVTPTPEVQSLVPTPTIEPFTEQVTGLSVSRGAEEKKITTLGNNFRLNGKAVSPDGSPVSTVVMDNISTGETGFLYENNSKSTTSEIGFDSEIYTLKPGKNEILLTVLSINGSAATQKVVIEREVQQPVVSNIRVNGTDVPVYEKFEVQFDLETTAEYPFFQYDPSPPEGVNPGVGVTVEIVITPPSGKQVVHPGFYISDTRHSNDLEDLRFFKGIKTSWMVRYSPQEIGKHTFFIRAQDRSGTVESRKGSFVATQPNRQGFIQVSRADPRYFEFSDGSLYWPVGPAHGIDYAQYEDTGLNMERIWLAGIGAYSTNFARWISSANDLGNEGYDSRLNFHEHYPSHELSQEITFPDAWRMWIGWLNGEMYRPELKTNTEYLVQLRLKTTEIQGPVDPQKPYGFVVKTGGWPEDNFNEYMSLEKSMIEPVYTNNDWHTILARFRTPANQDEIGPFVFLYLENVTAGKVFIDKFSLREILPDGSLAGEQIVNPDSDLHTYVEQGAAAFIDWRVEQAEKYGVYLKLVIQDKRDWVHEHLKTDGSFAETGDGYYQKPGTKSYWLQTQWWRYLIARWGYSTSIHSWELNNEGSPDEQGHYEAAQAFAKYMRLNDAHSHLSTTSFWCCWRPEFWGDQTKYPDIGYADIHEYVQDESALSNYLTWFIQQSQELYQDHVGKPIMYGEIGFSSPDSHLFTLMEQENNGSWFHDMLWSQLGPNPVYIPHYWWREHLEKINAGQISLSFQNFIQNLDLNKGGYSDAAAVSDNQNLILLGQKNTANGKAYLWIKNANVNWYSLLNGAQLVRQTPISAQISIKMNPEQTYTVQYWNTNLGEVMKSDEYTAGPDGNLAIDVPEIESDIALIIIEK